MKLHTRHVLIVVLIGVALLVIASLAHGWLPPLGKFLGGVSGLK
jgi:hypothetical protein